MTSLPSGESPALSRAASAPAESDAPLAPQRFLEEQLARVGEHYYSVPHFALLHSGSQREGLVLFFAYLVDKISRSERARAPRVAEGGPGPDGAAAAPAPASAPAALSDEATRFLAEFWDACSTRRAELELVAGGAGGAGGTGGAGGAGGAGGDSDARFERILQDCYEKLRAGAARFGLIPPAGVAAAQRKGAEVAAQLCRARNAAVRTLLAAGIAPEAAWRPSNMIDVGCGDGSTTIKFAEALGVAPEAALGLEYETPHQARLQPMGALRGASGFVYGLYPGSRFIFRVPDAKDVHIAGDSAPAALGAAHTLPFREPFQATDAADIAASFDCYTNNVRAGSVDLVSAVHVLHHVPLEARRLLLCAVARALRPRSGLFVVKEHDCDGDGCARFLDAVHIFKQRVVYSEEKEYMPFSRFESAAEWERQAREAGLELVSSEPEPGARMRDLLMVFRAADAAESSEAPC